MIASHLSQVSPLLVEVAQGRKKADLLLKNGTLVDVYSGEILESIDVAIAGDRVAYVGSNGDHTVGAETTTLNLLKKYIIPGLIDGHTHLDLWTTPREFSREAVLHGVTSIFAEPDELVNVLGYRGLRLFLKEASTLPLRLYTLIPLIAPQDSRLERTHSLSFGEVRRTLRQLGAAGLGEAVSVIRVLEGDREYQHKIRDALRLGKGIEGHTAGMRGMKLIAYFASGISSCHEPIRVEEVVERLRLGVWVMLREGSIRRELDNIIPSLLEKRLDFRRLVLASDSVDPTDLKRIGYMDHAVRRAVELGLDPVRAVQMATLNPAEHFGVDGDIGGVAPSKLADLVILNDLERVDVETVICGGRIIYRRGKFLEEEEPLPPTYPSYALRTMRIKAPLKLSDLEVEVPRGVSHNGSVEVRVASLENETITRGKILSVPVRSGVVNPSREMDLWKVAVVDRHWSSGRIGLGFVQGFHIDLGAIATSLNLDQNNLLAVGREDSDMVAAVNAVIGMGGGIALVEGGVVLSSLRMELGGVMATAKFGVVEEGLRRIEGLLKKRGSPFRKPLNPVLFLTFVTLPEIRFTERGMVDVKSRRFCQIFPAA